MENVDIGVVLSLIKIPELWIAQMVIFSEILC